MVHHAGDLWIARPVGDDHQYLVSIVGAGSSRDVRLDYGQQVLSSSMASTPVGVVLVVSGVEDHVPHVWISTDGETWVASTITDAPLDVSGVVWLDGRFVASGSKRVGDNPSMGPFQAALFESSDGIEWFEIRVPEDLFGVDGFLSAPVVVGDRVVVAGQFRGAIARAALFESLDAGASWSVAAVEGPTPSRLAVVDDLLVGSGAYDPEADVDHNIVIGRAGRWELVDLGELTGPAEYRSAYLVGHGDDVAVFQVDYARPIEYCYEDRASCGKSSLVVLLGPDGTPTAIDLGVPDVEVDVDTATTDSDGSFHILIATERGVELRTWPESQGPVPTLPAPTVSEPAGPPVVEWDATLEVGGVYRFPLQTHCGIDVLGRFNGSNWWLYDTPAVDFTGNGGGVLGEIHVIAGDRIDYVLDGRTVAVYEPRAEQFPGCE
jgi:hypothetical protein